MTASAMAQDREMCIAAGMDDFLAKPIRQTDLEGVVRRWANAPPIVNTDLEAWLVDAYLAEETVIQDELRAALQARDGARVAAAAQAEGAAAIVGADRLVALASNWSNLGGWRSGR
jgi:CheY-like chemotaxis protein